VLEQQQWAAAQQQVLDKYHSRCAISGAPASQLPQPLRVVPQWQFDYIKQQVLLGRLIPVCEPLYQLTQRLAGVADQLAALSPSLQLPAEAAGGDAAAAAGAVLPASEQIGGQPSGVHAQHAEAAAAAVAGLTAEQQEAFKWLALFLRWPEVDCVRYVAYAGWRRQQLLEQGGWQFVAADAARLAAILS
jgi:hypothetical protein